MTPSDLASALPTPEILTELAEATCLATTTRRDGTCWHHTVKVRPGKRCPLVVELYSAGAVKAWSQALGAELGRTGLRVVVSKTVRRWLNVGLSSRPNGFACCVSILGRS